MAVARRRQIRMLRQQARRIGTDHNDQLLLRQARQQGLLLRRRCQGFNRQGRAMQDVEAARPQRLHQHLLLPGRPGDQHRGHARW